MGTVFFGGGTPSLLPAEGVDTLLAAVRARMPLAPDAEERLMAHPWPGNVRELENAIERAVVLGSTEIIQPDDLPDRVLQADRPGGAASLQFHEAMKEAKRHIGDRVQFAASALAACEGADGLLLVTEWSEFRTPDFGVLAAKLRDKVIFDGRNLYEPQQMVEEGFTYFSMGRPAVRTGGAK